MSPLRAWLWLGLGAGLAAPAPAARAACAVEQLEAALGAQASRWRESGASGEPLLAERGTLRAWSLAMAGPCAGLQWAARAEGQSGTRDYEGRSSTGAALSTHSDVRSRRLSLQAWHEPEGRAWALGARLGWEPDARRELASVGPVQGYEERRERWRLGLGVRGHHALPAGWIGRWEAWLDTGPRARLSLRGAPFGAQALLLGEGRWEALALGWTVGPAAVPGQWQPWLGWQWEGLRSRAGRPEALRLDSGRVLAVSQPAYRQADWRLMAGLRLDLE